MRNSLWEQAGRQRTSACRTIATVTALALLLSVLLGSSLVFQATAAQAHTTMAGQQNGTSVQTRTQIGTVARLDVFVRGADNALWHRWTDLSTGIQSSWESLGGHLDSAPAAVAGGSTPYTIDVVYRDGINIQHVEVFTLSSQTTFHRENLGHYHIDNDVVPGFPIFGSFPVDFPATSAPAISSWGSGRLDVFAFSGGTLTHRWFDGDWHDWEGLGSGLLSDDPAAVSWGPGRIDVFVHGGAEHLYGKVFDGRWRNWQDLGGILTSSPAATSAGSGQLNVFVRNTANGLSQRTFSAGQWGAWSNIDSNTMNSAPTAAFEKGRGRMHVFTRGFNNMLWYNFNNAGFWAHWDPQNTPGVGMITVAPAATVGNLAYYSSSPPVPR